MDTEEEEPLLTCYTVRRFPSRRFPVSGQSNGQCFDCGLKVYLGNMVYHDPWCRNDYCEKHWHIKQCDCGIPYCHSTFRCVDCASKILEMLTMKRGYVVETWCGHTEFVDDVVLLKCRPLFRKVPTKSARATAESN